MIFLLFASLVTFEPDIQGKRNASNLSANLVADLRRQLMEDNYDYLPTETEEDFPLNRNNVNSHKSPENLLDDYDYHENDKLRMEMPHIVPRVHEEEDKNKEGSVSKKDLYYYMNDERIGLVNNNFYEDVKEYKNVSTPKVKYKFIKVKPAFPNRRSLTARRFIEERGKDGVAILNLDDEPFPEFRLPKSRRQYMHETSDNDDVSNFKEFSLEEADDN